MNRDTFNLVLDDIDRAAAPMVPAAAVVVGCWPSLVVVVRDEFC